MSFAATTIGLKESLLVHYENAATRIASTLDGVTTIDHAPTRALPSSMAPYSVAGGCGFRGCHPYFWLDVNDLRTAVGDILAVTTPAGVVDVDAAVGELREICRRLRRRTTFDYLPDCAHASRPELGPLLPPQVIWWNGGQLPLDVWRLIAFDNDLVSSGISAGVDIADLRDGISSYSGLLFARLMNRTRGKLVTFRIDEKAFGPPYEGAIEGNVTLSLARLFLEAGVLLTPFSDKAPVSAWFPAIRYLEWLSFDSPELRVKSEFRDNSVDSRYKGLFSEEIAIGMMAVALYERLGATGIFNTSEILPDLQGERWDFVCGAVDPSGADIVIAAESKGSIGKMVPKGRRIKAKKQARTARGSSSSRVAGLLEVAFCSGVYYDDQPRGRSHCLVEDPEPTRPFSFKDLDAAERWRIAYAKALRFAGLEAAASEVYNGQPVSSFQGDDERHHDDDHRLGHDIMPLREVESGAFIIDRSVFEVLAKGLNIETVEVLESHLRRSALLRKEARLESTLFLNGLGVGFAEIPEEGLGRVERQRPW